MIPQHRNTVKDHQRSWYTDSYILEAEVDISRARSTRFPSQKRPRLRFQKFKALAPQIS
jgi:hypothetical protein